jgi:tricarballylate dehydrogenase
LSAKYDVAVLGGGNAALSAALTAAERGASVIVVERAPRAFRGGNSRHTRNLRCMHAAPTDVLTDTYPEDEFMADLLRVTGGLTDHTLASMMIRASADLPRRMSRFGVRFQPSLRCTLHLGRTNAFFLGGGKALMNSAYAAAERLGVRIVYDAEVVGLCIRDGRFESAEVQTPHGAESIAGRTVVLAAGGFESNLDWLGEIWGEAASNFIIRGTPYNTGTVLRLMLDAGAEPVGDPSQCHAVAIDARAPKFDGGIVTRLDSVPLGIVVNRHGDRFYDEGEDYWPKRYAIWGRLVAQQPDQIAYSIVDAKAVGRFMPSVFPPIVAGSIRELGSALGIPAGTLAATIERFNAAVRPGTFDHQTLDDCRTEGLVPNKTHWAQRLDAPPFHAYPLRPGITFTYLGVKVDEHARVVMKGGLADNIFAAGEIMAGNILGRGYVAGVGMTIGTVFGEIAGRESAAFRLGVRR